MEIRSDHQKNMNLRNDPFKNNPKLDDLIEQLRELLEPVELQFAGQFSAPRLPVILVIGNSRSGSTLLTQILAASGDFAYPSNVLNRFAYAPAIGAMIQQMLFNKEFGYLDELSDIQSVFDYKSNLGKTDGAMGISEFYHFWRRFIPNYHLGHLASEDLSDVDIPGLRSELAALEAIFGKPFMCKGKAIQFNILDFAMEMPELFFIHIERNPLFVMQSILQSRRKYYRSDSVWFGVRPAAYPEIKELDVYHQIAGQVFLTDHTIQKQLASLDSTRIIHCQYEELCENPEGFYERFVDALAAKGIKLILEHIKPRSFQSANTQKLSTEELDQLQSAYDEIRSQYI